MSARKLKLRLETTTFTHFQVILPGLEHRETRATREIGPVRTPPLDCAAPPLQQAQGRRLSGPRLKGLGDCCCAFPALKGWAILCRPYGTHEH